MAEEKLLTIRDVSILLGITEKEVMDLAESGKLPAYKIGGMYLRFKPQQVDEFKRQLPQTAAVTGTIRSTFAEKIGDFLYFNDFYILSAVLILLLLSVIIKGY